MSDMRIFPRYQTFRATMGLLEKIVAVDPDANDKIAALLPRDDAAPQLRERMQFFIKGAENIKTLSLVFISRAFLSAPSQRKREKAPASADWTTAEDILNPDKKKSGARPPQRACHKRAYFRDRRLFSTKSGYIRENQFLPG